MRIETRVPGALRLRHCVQFHHGHADLSARAVALARARLHAGDQLALALPATVERTVLDAVGTAGVTVLARPDPAVASGQTTAALRARELRALLAGDPGVTMLSAHDPALDGADGGYWTEFDAALNIALADLPVDVVCLYPSFPLHLEVLEGARANHPHELVGERLRPVPEHRCPKQVLSERPRSAPAVLAPPDVELTYNSWELHQVRRLVADTIHRLGFTETRAEDLVLAINEIATNAVEHGSPTARIQLWAGRDGLVCEIHDDGTLAEPLPGLTAPHPAELRGRGLWIARQLCDLLHVWRDATGTHVRLRAAP